MYIKNWNEDARNAYLRCYGFGFIRAIDMEKKLFYVVTPVTKDLNRVKVFALGYELQTPPDMILNEVS